MPDRPKLIGKLVENHPDGSVSFRCSYGSRVVTLTVTAEELEDPNELGLRIRRALGLGSCNRPIEQG